MQLKPAGFAETFDRVIANGVVHILPQLIERFVRGSIGVADYMLGFANDLTR